MFLMSSDSSQFDPYHKWFGIPRDEQPPDHYRLLRIQRFESDLDVIDNAYNTAMRELKTRENESADWVEQIGRELMSVRQCLLNAEKKSAYDDELRGKIQELVVQPPPRPKVTEHTKRSDEAPRVAANPAETIGGSSDSNPVSDPPATPPSAAKEVAAKQPFPKWMKWGAVGLGTLAIPGLLLAAMLMSQKGTEDDSASLAGEWADLTKYAFAAEQHGAKFFAVNQRLPNLVLIPTTSSR